MTDATASPSAGLFYGRAIGAVPIGDFGTSTALNIYTTGVFVFNPAAVTAAAKPVFTGVSFSGSLHSLSVAAASSLALTHVNALLGLGVPTAHGSAVPAVSGVSFASSMHSVTLMTGANFFASRFSLALTEHSVGLSTNNFILATKLPLLGSTGTLTVKSSSTKTLSGVSFTATLHPAAAGAGTNQAVTGQAMHTELNSLHFWFTIPTTPVPNPSWTKVIT